MSKIKTAIILNNRGLIEAVWEHLESCGIFDLVGTARESEAGLKLLVDTQPEVAILDALTPALNGCDLIAKAQASLGESMPLCVLLCRNDCSAHKPCFGENPKVIVTGLPLDMRAVSRRIVSLYNKYLDTGSNKIIFRLEPKPESNPEDYVVSLLNALCQNRHKLGYAYLQTAMLLAFDDPALLESLSKELYPAVASRHKTSSAGVERAIRIAITEIFGQPENKEALKNYGLGSFFLTKPTNRRFLKLVSQRYRDGLLH